MRGGRRSALTSLLILNALAGVVGGGWLELTGDDAEISFSQHDCKVRTVIVDGIAFVNSTCPIISAGVDLSSLRAEFDAKIAELRAEIFAPSSPPSTPVPPLPPPLPSAPPQTPPPARTPYALTISQCFQPSGCTFRSPGSNWQVLMIGGGGSGARSHAGGGASGLLGLHQLPESGTMITVIIGAGGTQSHT